MKPTIVSFILVLFMSCQAYADDTKPATCAVYAKADKSSSCVVLSLQNLGQGVWYPLSRSEILRKEHLIVPQLQLQIEKLQGALVLEESRSALLQLSSNTLKEENLKLVEKLNQSEKNEIAAENRLNAWYRRPVLWFCAGLVVSSAVIVAVAR